MLGSVSDGVMQHLLQHDVVAWSPQLSRSVRMGARSPVTSRFLRRRQRALDGLRWYDTFS